MSEDVFLTFIPGKKQKSRKPRLLLERPLLCLCGEGSGHPIPALPAKHPCWVLRPSALPGCVRRCGLGKSHSKHQNDVPSSTGIFFLPCFKWYWCRWAACAVLLAQQGNIKPETLPRFGVWNN